MTDLDSTQFHKDLQRLIAQGHWDGAARLFATVTYGRPLVRHATLKRFPEFANPDLPSDRLAVQARYEESAA